jgi:hypothetical protein
MVYWRGQPLERLQRSEMERAATEAINELMGLRASDNRRQSFDSIILSFLFGATFSAAAVIVGLLFNA